MPGRLPTLVVAFGVLLVVAWLGPARDGLHPCAGGLHPTTSDELIQPVDQPVVRIPSSTTAAPLWAAAVLAAFVGLVSSGSTGRVATRRPAVARPAWSSPVGGRAPPSAA